MTDQTTRVNFQMDDKSLNRLKRLKKDVGAASHAEITANSYRLYKYLIQLEKQGKTLVVRSDND